MFAKLHNKYGEAILINFDHIIEVTPTDDKGVIISLSNKTDVVCKESLEAIERFLDVAMKPISTEPTVNASKTYEDILPSEVPSLGKILSIAKNKLYKAYEYNSNVYNSSFINNGSLYIMISDSNYTLEKVKKNLTNIEELNKGLGGSSWYSFVCIVGGEIQKAENYNISDLKEKNFFETITAILAEAKK